MVAIGIDLGTTNSCVCIYRKDKVEIIPNEKGENTTPSYVGFLENGRRLIGEEAKQKAPFNPENTVFDAKRLIGRKFKDPSVQKDIKHWPFQVVDEGAIPKIRISLNGKERNFYAEEISSMILGKLRDIAEKYLKASVKKCVITVPAYFNDSQRQATIHAGEIAGLNVMQIINEPTAAAIAYGFNKNSAKEQIVLVYDLGGGTFDVSILKIKGLKMKVLSTGGDTHLGGQDFDSQVMSYVIDEFEKKHGVNIKNNKKAIRRIRSACENAKIQISSATHTDIEIASLISEDEYAVVPTGLDLKIKLTRSKFEELNLKLFESTISVVENCLKEAKLKKSDVDEIVLVGGSTRIPKVRSIVQNFFDGKELNQTIHPDEAVAHGAAISAAIQEGDKSKRIEDCEFLDITPMSLGTDVASGDMSVIIPKNSPIPVKLMKKYYTCSNNQSRVLVEVREGENKKFVDNNLLGKFIVSNLPLKKAREVKVQVTFEIDYNGILKAHCVETTTNVNKSIEIKYEKGRLSNEELERIRRENNSARHEEMNQNEISLLKNQIYEYCCDMKYDLEDNYKYQSSKSEYKEIIEKCDEITDWVDSNHNVAKYEYTQKLKEVKSFCQRMKMFLV